MADTDGKTESIKPKSASMQNLLMPALIAGVVGVGFVTLNQSQKNQQDNISDLPAMDARITNNTNALQSLRGDMRNADSTQHTDLTALREEIKALQQALADTLDSDALQAQFTGVNASLEDVEEQLARRITLEVKDPIQSDFADLEKDMDLMRAELLWLRGMALGHMTTPPTTHHDPN